MANIKYIIKLDNKLIDLKIIDKTFSSDYIKVHKFLNTKIKKTGKILSDEMFKEGETFLRNWLQVLLKKGASKERLTNYLKCGLGHLCYDFIDSTSLNLSNDDLVTRTLQSFKKRKYNKTFFKGSIPEQKPKKVQKKTQAKKTAKTKLKKSPTAAKKTSVKKVVSKKTTKNKNIKKTSSKSTAKSKNRSKKSNALLFKIIDFLK